MKKLFIEHLRHLAAYAALWLILDQVSKAWANRGLHEIQIVDNFFSLTLHHNQGIAFGFFFGQWPQIIISLAILGLLSAVAIHEWKGDGRNAFLNRALLGVIVGGALGNLVDRIRLGYVIDFISLQPFPIFNLADIGITLGLISLVLLNIRETKF